MNRPQLIDISTSTIFRVILILLGLVFLYLIFDILLLVFISIVIAAAINSPVNWLQEHRVPRILGVIFIYLFLLLLLALIVTLILPPLAGQIKQLADYFPALMEKLNVSFHELGGKYSFGGDLQGVLDNIGNKLNQAASSIVGTIIGIFGGIFSAIIVLVISFYLAVQEKGIKRFLISLTPDEQRHYLSGLIDRIESKIGAWLRGQLVLMLIIGVLIFIGLHFLGVKYALALALIACLFEIVPYIGPIISAIPAVIIAFSQSPILALLVVILFIVVQQMENYLIVPQIMKRAVGLSPVVIIIIMLIGGKLAGILGIVLSVPIAASIAEFFKDFKK